MVAIIALTSATSSNFIAEIASDNPMTVPMNPNNGIAHRATEEMHMSRRAGQKAAALAAALMFAAMGQNLVQAQERTLKIHGFGAQSGVVRIFGLNSETAMRAAIRARPGANRPDTQVLFGMYSAELTGALGKLPEKDHGFCALVYPLRPQSLGSIHIASRDPAAPPEIVPNYGDVAEDRHVIVDATRAMRRFAQQEPLKSLIAAEIHPGPEVESDEAILDFLDRNGMACLHAVGSCRMGRDDDPMAVVGPRLAVRGMQGLHIADASVMPTITSGNTNSPTLMIAEQAAQWLREGEGH